MKDDTRRQKLAALLGLDTQKASGPPPRILKENRSREAEALIKFEESPQSFTRITCKVCKDDFLVDRANVTCCSDSCRAKALEAIGIEWDWSKPPSDRWYVSSQQSKLTNEPLVVMPEILRALETALLLWKPVENVTSLNEAESLN